MVTAAGHDGPLGAVVVGTSFGVITHVRALQRAGFSVRALVGRDLDKARRRADLMGVPEVAGSLGDALSLAEVDAVAVATPPSSHCPLVLEAVGAGKHVVCEKPFAMDVAEARAMHEAAERAGVVHLLGTEFRFATGQAQAARAVAAGVIGEPRHALFVLQLPTLSDPAAVIPGWWEDASVGGGWLGAHGSHVIDQVHATLGEIVAVSARLSTLSARPGMTADDTYTIDFSLAGGAEGTMYGSCALPGPFFGLTTMAGSAASLWVEGDQVRVENASGSMVIPTDEDLAGAAPVPPPAELLSTAYDFWHATGIDLHPYGRLYAELARRIRGGPPAAAPPGGPVAATFADGVAVQAVMDAVHRSSAERRWVDVGG